MTSLATSIPRTIVELLCWLMPPSRVKNFLLNKFGHDIAPTAIIWPSVVLGVPRVEVGDYGYIGLMNIIRNLSHIRLEGYARIDSWNWISAHPSYRQLDPKAGTLFMAACSRVGSRCYLDCSGTIVLRYYGFVGGHYCMLYTHAPDYATDSQTIGRITVDHHSMICSRSVVLKGAFLPARSLLAANSTLMESSALDRRSGLYAGNPAVWKRETSGGGWFARRTYSTHGHSVDGAMGALAEDQTPAEFAAPPIDVRPDSLALLSEDQIDPPRSS